MPDPSSAIDLAGVHDAGTGFHDIKALPEFTPFPWTSALLGLAALCILLLILLRRRAPAQTPKPAPPLSPLDSALGELRQLALLRRDQRISLREFSSRCSLVYRGYLEDCFQFPARDRTSAETVAELPLVLKKCTPLLPAANAAEIAQTTRKLLRFYEQAAFADDALDRYNLQSPELENIFQETECTIRTLDVAIQRETERKRSVMDPLDTQSQTA